MRVLLLAPLAAWLTSFDIAASAERPAPLSERIGIEIDAEERNRYGLFPDVREFEAARIDSTKKAFRLTYTEKYNGELRSRSRSIGRETFEQTRWHVAFSDEFARLAPGDSLASAPATSEGDLLRRIALRYATRKRYDLASAIASDLRQEFAADSAGLWAIEAHPRLDALAGAHRALIWPGALLDQRGRTDLLVFSGLYGIWLGIAIPVALEADDAQAYAAGLLTAPAISVLLAHHAARDASITKGQARIISLGGLFGTWQGLGWSGVSDAAENTVVGAGAVAGLVGIGLAIPLTHAVHFSEGHGEITNSAMYWGGWFGFVESTLTGRNDESDNSPLVDMLVVSGASVITAGIAAHGARLSEGRMRLINLSGILGAAFGGGMALLGQLDDTKGNVAILAAGSIAGLGLGIHWTRNYDQGRDFASADSGPEVEPVFAMRPSGNGRGAVPAAGLRVRF